VRKLIAGPSVFICDECVAVCQDIIAQDERFESRYPVDEKFESRHPVAEGWIAPKGHDLPVPAQAVRCSLCRLPAPIEDVVYVPERGALCPGCIDAIRAALAEHG